MDDVVVDVKRDPQCLGRSLSNPFGIVDRGVVVQQDGEFVAAETSHGVFATHTAEQTLRESHQQCVARLVSEAIVDHFEVVEVEIQDDDRMVRSVGARQRVPDTIKEERAVCERGEGIVPAGSSGDVGLASIRTLDRGSVPT
jgi:hypothetical protein